MSSTTHVERPSTLLDRALAGASNDEAVELAFELFEALADRVERAVDIAIDCDDRDAENEALAFASEVDGLFPFLGGKGNRMKRASYVVDDAKRDIERAIRNRRSETGRGPSRIERFSDRRNARVQSAWEASRRREEKAAAKTVQRADVSRERVLEAISRLDPGQFQARDVAIALLPELADTGIVGRQAVINAVATVIRHLATKGTLEQHRPDGSKGRMTCRYTLVAAQGASDGR